MRKLKTPGSGENTIKRQPESVHPYHAAKNPAQLKDLSYEEFKKIADKTPFTLSEWASILHVSERTLQRYAKNNSTFSPINAERFFQISQVISRGKKVFGKINLFYEWLHSKPPMLEGELSFESLKTYDGIQKILTQLGRLEHGILA